MNNELHDQHFPAPGQENDQQTSLSRRKWLTRVSAPALAMAGAGMIGTSAVAADSNKRGGIDQKLLGAGTYNVRDFGAKGDGKTLDTAAVQAAIDACNWDKGGTVLVPAGDFLIGTIELKSNVTLHLAVQGRLLGSPEREHYTAGKGVPPGNGNIVLLYAVNAENVTIEGRGTVDGNGTAFYNGKGDGTGPNGTPGNMDRPHLAIFYQCTNLLVRDAFFTKSAYHCFRLLKCKQVVLNGVRIYNRVNKNNDGFHFNDSQYVHIMNCDVACQDDACALFGSNQYVTVTNCTFSTRWSIFRFGGGKAQNITVSNCIINDTYGCPVKISTGRGQIENLLFSNIVMRNVTGPIGIGFSGMNRRNNAGNNNNVNANNANAATNTNANENTQPVEPSFVRNIVFQGIRATVVKAPINHPDIPFEVHPFNGETNSCITLNAMGEFYLENISFTDVQVSFAGGGSAELAAKRDIPQIASEYFGVWDAAPFGPPAYGMYARNVKGLSLYNVRFEYQQEDLRPAVIFDNVQDATISGLSVQGNKNAESTMRFINVKDVLLTGTRVLTPAAVFLRLEGASNEGITVEGGDLRKAGKALVFAAGAQEAAVTLRT